MSRTILHSDCNCFYASVELLHHPELRGKPVAVGGDPEARHGIVLTADYIAKKHGVKTLQKFEDYLKPSGVEKPKESNDLTVPVVYGSPQRESKFMQIDSSCKSSETSI